MTWLSDPVLEDRPLSAPAALPAERRMADALRSLAITTAEAVGADHPGLAVGMADTATVLWSQFHRFDAAAPRWPDRDRFVLSPGYGALPAVQPAAPDRPCRDGSGRAGAAPAARQPHQRPSRIRRASGDRGDDRAARPGAGRRGRHGAGGAAAGGAVRQKPGRPPHLGARHARRPDGGRQPRGRQPCGHLRLEKLVVLLEEDTSNADCSSMLAGQEDALRRFAAAGWATRTVDAHDAEQITAALSLAGRSRKPTLIACRTTLCRDAFEQVRCCRPRCRTASRCSNGRSRDAAAPRRGAPG